MKPIIKNSGFAAVAGLLLNILVLGVSGCAGGGGRAGTIYSENLGTGTLYDINTKSQAILNRYQYRIERVESTTDLLYIETEWKNRYPFDDEIEQGVNAALTRIVIRATPRGRGVGSDNNSIRFEGENKVRYQGGEEWHIVPMSPMLIAHFKDITDDLITDLRTGFRKF
ncbi:MAG: hypothetical protein FJ215_06050 [Ignavibacteria bacterium]|nr:hypothetical protein [Ignavibacteria bacterium]